MADWRDNSKSGNGGRGYRRGMTFRALAASILCMTLAAIYTNHTAVVVRESWTIPESAIPVPAVLALLGLTMFTGLLAAAFKLRILTKEELLCVAFATMMAVPLMSQGFWLRFVGMVAATPMNQNFDYIDALDDRLWPHGPNLADFTDNRGAGPSRPAPSAPRLAGNAAWAFGEIENGLEGRHVVISNSAAGDVSFVEWRFESNPDDAEAPDFREPFLVSVLARGVNAEAETEVFAETVGDDGLAAPMTLFREQPSLQRSWLHKTGYSRIGRFGVIPAQSRAGGLVLRIGARGRGRVDLAAPRFFSVAPLLAIYEGRRTVDEADWDAMPPDARPPYAAVRPARILSWRSAAYYGGGLVPFGAWARPMAIWGSYVLLLLGALFCVNAAMRRKWADGERYPMPNTRIPLALVGAGAGDGDCDSPFAAIWRNRFAWAGLVFALCFGLLKGAHFFNPHFPDMAMRIPIGDYISNPVFGGMFNVEFVFSLFICSMAVFLELNVLMSLVVGYWACRLIFLFGHVTGIESNRGFPWFDEQAVGAYMGYFAITAVLSSKYFWGLLKDAFRGRGGDGEVLSPRLALAGFALCAAGVAVWARFTGSSALAMETMFAILAICGFIAAKFRVECGSPFGYFAPFNVMLLMGVMGGARVFGSQGMLVSLLLSGILTVCVFYLIPGMQFEIMETGRRMRIRPRHIAYTCLVGALGGLLIGGLVFLSNGYAAGAESLRGAGFYNSYGWYVMRIRTQLALATGQWLGQGGDASGATDWGRVSMVASGCTMAALAVLRQYFAGFWFHPVGFMIGFTQFNYGANWGTLLVACGIRWGVLKVGGAKAVRTKMMPFFIGVFIGCALSIGIFTLVNGHAVAIGSSNFYNLVP